jgi:D-beta-D-heptose 7-phosphate kinase/D-beta-D-heptose 1-phosphate adenosyltransferase
MSKKRKIGSYAKEPVIVVTSGYFDPIHVGHLEMLKLSKSLGDELVTIVNNDEQARLKKGKSFMGEKDRLEILKCIKYVNTAFLSVDNDKTVCDSLKRVRRMYSKNRIIFANGGDRKEYEIPEAKVCKKLDIEIVDGLGDKIRSSSDIVKGK